MTFSGNGTTKKIVVTVVAALLIGLITQVLLSTNRISILETKMTTIERAIEINRVENNQAHEKIGGQLTELLREVAKK